MCIDDRPTKRQTAAPKLWFFLSVCICMMITDLMFVIKKVIIFSSWFWIKKRRELDSGVTPFYSSQENRHVYERIKNQNWFFSVEKLNPFNFKYAIKNSFEIERRKAHNWRPMIGLKAIHSKEKEGLNFAEQYVHECMRPKWGFPIQNIWNFLMHGSATRLVHMNIISSSMYYLMICFCFGKLKKTTKSKTFSPARAKNKTQIRYKSWRPMNMQTRQLTRISKLWLIFDVFFPILQTFQNSMLTTHNNTNKLVHLYIWRWKNLKKARAQPKQTENVWENMSF